MSVPDPTIDQRPVFSVDATGFAWDDVFAHARRHSAWAALETQVRQAKACERLAAAHDLLPDVVEERAAAQAFRLERRLYAAEDLEAWLAERGLSVAQWRDHIRESVLRRQHAEDLDAVFGAYPPTDAEVEAALPVWGVCTGAFGRSARDLAARAAAAQAAWARGTGGQAPAPGRLDVLDALYDRFTEQAARHEALEALVASRYLDWLRVECEQVTFPHDDAAREALLCVRDDGWTLTVAARAAGAEAVQANVLVRDADPEVRHRLLAAQDGDVLGPLQLPAGPALVHVVRKTAPDVDDPELRALAVREVIDAAVAREVDDRVRWLEPL
jgi:hypothetical protein